MEIDPPKMALVGMDVVSLLPSLMSKNTSEIVRKKVTETKMKIEGFDWKRAMIYVKMNRKYVGEIKKELKKFLPIRTSQRGTEPGMSSESYRKEKKLKKQWFFIKKEPNEQEMKEMAGMVAQVGIRVLWENYCFDFGGKTYLQKKGGPIGQRPTMAASRLVMNDHLRSYKKIFLTAQI